MIAYKLSKVNKRKTSELCFVIRFFHRDTSSQQGRKYPIPCCRYKPFEDGNLFAVNGAGIFHYFVKIVHNTVSSVLVENTWPSPRKSSNTNRKQRNNFQINLKIKSA